VSDNAARFRLAGSQARVDVSTWHLHRSWSNWALSRVAVVSDIEGVDLLQRWNCSTDSGVRTRGHHQWLLVDRHCGCQNRCSRRHSSSSS
jgi:hypothetical protein